MKFLSRPTQPKLPTTYRITTREQFVNLDNVWKQIVKENRDNDNGDFFAPLFILRNIILERDMYTGFTPCLSNNKLKNGRGFCDGFHHAYNRLQNVLKSDQHSQLQNSCYRLLFAVSSTPPKRSFDSAKIFDGLLTYYCDPFYDSYISKVQKTIIKIQDNDDGDSLKGLTYTQLFDLVDEKHTYNMIRREEYPILKKSPMLKDTLAEFARKYIITRGLSEEKVSSVKLVDDPSFMLITPDGVDTKINRDYSNLIEINTRTKYLTSDKSDKKSYSLPVSHLWEVDWLKEYA